MLIPLYMFVSHYKFTFSRMKLDELILVPVIMVMIFCAVHAVIWILNRLIAVEFRMTYNSIRPLIGEKPFGMVGRLGAHHGRDSVEPGEIRRMGAFGSDQYSLHLCRDIHVSLPIKGERGKHLIEQGRKMGSPFRFDEVSGKLQLVPYFVGTYLIPISVLFIVSLVSWSDYFSAKESQLQERQTLAFEEDILERRLSENPMTRAECESQTGSAYLCDSRACIPASEGPPESYRQFERVSAGQADFFCPSVSALEENAKDARQSLEADNRYSPPIAKLVPALLTLGAAALVALLMALESLRHLIAFTRSGRPSPTSTTPPPDHSDEQTGPSPLLLAGGCLVAITLLGGLVTVLAGAAYLGYMYFVV